MPTYKSYKITDAQGNSWGTWVAECEMEAIIDLIADVQENPALYLGTPKICGLKAEEV